MIIITILLKNIIEKLTKKKYCTIETQLKANRRLLIGGFN